MPIVDILKENFPLIIVCILVFFTLITMIVMSLLANNNLNVPLLLMIQQDASAAAKRQPGALGNGSGSSTTDYPGPCFKGDPADADGGGNNGGGNGGGSGGAAGRPARIKQRKCVQVLRNAKYFNNAVAIMASIMVVVYIFMTLCGIKK